ncbi:Fe3+ hydroxamate ABC transporter substrate-binding protein [Exiguobacterium sp. Leaf187]|jgi:hypothetical protein|uniref:Fe3+ hydroxamate ABC transporter substrate-binding protein n=1 Tax=Exiguobacterium indicum TaxID=296995 RepID=A0AAW3MF44_9BACL|nr:MULTISPECIES: hypothetical protein [Exiguobacterium]AHA29868.1 Fe3+ hydroxamate ABC transporter substrate-binding protein [Exiguobacterium sp. MH3]KQS19026.1 Fe3+ hydroxamate ABC transporter substrate-binding protein [Exiguobacterium sp. Leaf187]KTR27854.1 Fe3+ hydroxamate ABC transporter substrate-binding protein [Exiguobacterium indicum]NTY09660.1 Fe3+ hydroxamate ABC transporter substrate-binding protein [Exiguobacterium sp. JMULE1]OAI89678.1 Fe3+ hydroxamate ABC transporter substrate-bi
MFGKEPTCMHCGKTIEGNEKVYIQMRYPKHRGMTEVKAYLKSEGRFICEQCFAEKTESKG